MKNPFANLFKKKSKDGAPDKPVPKPDAGKKNCLLYTSPSPRDTG